MECAFPILVSNQRKRLLIARLFSRSQRFGTIYPLTSAQALHFRYLSGYCKNTNSVHRGAGLAERQGQGGGGGFSPPTFLEILKSY